MPSLEKYRGSEWNRWDLHFHTPASFDCDYNGVDFNDLAIQSLTNEKVRAVVVTDHHFIDIDRIKKLTILGIDKVVFFPGVELRTNTASPNVHIILIFSNKSNYDDLKGDFDAFKRTKALPKQYTDDNIYFPLNDISKFAEEHHALISIHAGSKANGIDKITNALPVAIASKEEYAAIVDIFEVSKTKDIEDYSNIVFKHVPKRPVIICSDNHDIRKYEMNASLWIKGEICFETLRQAVIHADERVFIGDFPVSVDSARKNPSRYLDYISISRKDNAKQSNQWFNQNLYFNLGMNTIIGNKGSGKSALSDIIGLSGNSRNSDHFSFLSNRMFRNPRKNLSVNYKAVLAGLENSWENTVFLNENTDKTKIEKVHYLPQSFIEETCNSLDDKFQNEIDKVIFSYLEIDEMEYFDDLDDYLKSKSASLEQSINECTEKLETQNTKIIDLEKYSTEVFQQEISEKYLYYSNELSVHEKNKPVEVEKPKDSSDDFEKNIAPTLMLVKQINDNIETKRSKLISNKSVLDKIYQFQKRYNELVENKNELNKLLAEISETTQHIKISFDTSQIASIRTSLELENLTLSTQIQSFSTIYAWKEDTDFLNVKSYVDKSTNLNQKIAYLNAYIDLMKNNSSKPQKEYLNYLNNKQQWEDKRKSIIGNDAIESLTYYQKWKEFIDLKLNKKIKAEYDSREETFSKLHNLYIKKIDLYNEIYKPIKEKLEFALQGINIQLNFCPENRFNSNTASDFLGKINQNLKSSFRGTSEGKKFVEDNIAITDLSLYSSVSNFTKKLINPIIDDVKKDNKLVVDKQYIYDYIYGLKYFEQKYILKYNNRELSQLSPGERGLVLLIFYLNLDKNEIPLVIDQPEDNLDNESIYNVLVKCIIKAKKHRQLIIVTHNPNIAIACDSELIIKAQIDKANNSIYYEPGSIELLKMNKEIVDVLEGTEPAFVLRKQKYILK